MEKSQLFERQKEVLANNDLEVVEINDQKPWGGYFRITEADTSKFRNIFYEGVELPEWAVGMRCDPKILVVLAGKRLSWQYHDRRGEVWKVIKGPVGVILSLDNNQGEVRIYHEGEVIEIPPGERHRLVGLDAAGVVAEIWVSTDVNQPSNEGDIHRLEDDFGRS